MSDLMHKQSQLIKKGIQTLHLKHGCIVVSVFNSSTIVPLSALQWEDIYLSLAAVDNSVNFVCCQCSKVRDYTFPWHQQFDHFYILNQYCMFIPGQGESPAGEKPVEGDLHPSPEPSPDDLSSPNPDQAAPLLQAQQRPPSRAERDEMRPGSAGGVGKMDAEIIETAAVKERADIQDSLVVADREISEQERTTEKDWERDRIEEEKDCEDEEAADRETADEGLPLSRGSEDENEEESEGQKEPPDANNNSLETPQDCQDDFIDIPEPPAQVGLTLIEM